MTAHPRYGALRTAIEVPILNDRYWAKVPSLDADAIMIDLEDSAPPRAKAEARRRARRAIDAADHFGGRMLVIRVNNLSTEWGADDLAMIASSDTDMLVCYPKAESADELAHVARAAGERAIWAMIETPRGLLGVPDMARTGVLAGLHFGYTDYCAELGLSPFDGSGIALVSAAAFAAHQIAAAAAAHGLFCSGGSLIPDFRDAAKVEAFLRNWIAAGFTACLALSPAHLAIVKRVFTASAEEVRIARAASAAFEAAVAAGEANTMFAGQMITLPEYRRLQHVLRRT